MVLFSQFILQKLKVLQYKIGMAQRQRQHSFNFNDEIAEPQSAVRNPKSTKTKFMKDLNYKSNVHIRSERNNKLLSNSKQKDYIIKKQRTRKNSSIQMGSLLQRAIPGAKILRGEWKDHKLNGDVYIQYDNGNKFEGQYQNGVRVQGKMTYAELNCQYQGSFFAQKFSGFGKLSYQGGRTIEGEWDNFEFVGNATITYPNGDVYYGPVDQKLYKHGEGYLFLHNGYKYIGQFKRGSITGMGSYFKDETLVVKGQWLKGKLIKQISKQQESDQIQMAMNPGVIDKQSTKDHFRYHMKENDEVNYQPQMQKSHQSSISSASILNLKSKHNQSLRQL